jgi:hypothetical protein
MNPERLLPSEDRKLEAFESSTKKDKGAGSNSPINLHILEA